jgi:hypothetical protein
MYRIPAHENIRRVREHVGRSRGFLAAISPSRSLLALFVLLQLAALWLFFTARFVSETTFVLAISILSGLFALATLVPARNGEEKKEPPLYLVVPERTFVPSPEAEMISPLVRLRMALRP